MNKLARPLELIEAEINFYKTQTANGIIEIGKRLIEAKEQIPHGEWGKWLEEKVDFSERTARRFMQAAREFSNRPALTDFEPTKVFLLLDVPAEQREEFAQQHNLEEMTTRQVEAAVKEWKQKCEKVESDLRLKEEALRSTQADMKKLQDELAKKSRELKEETERLRKKLDEAVQSDDSEEVEKLRDMLSKTEEARKAAEIRIDELEDQLKNKQIEVNAVETIIKVPDEVQKELEELRKKAAQPVSDATQRYKVFFDIIVDNFKKLLSTLGEIQQTDPASYSKYRKATAAMLQKLGEQVKDEPALTAEPAGHCGECVHADMDQVTDEQLDDCKTLCTKKNQIVDFEDAACEHYKSIRG